MLSIKQYVRPATLEEAYALCQKKRNVVLGGMLWLKMEKLQVDTAIDLSDLGLDQIKEDEKEFRIGAMVSLRELELHPALNQMTQGGFRKATEHIVGVQFRNLATVGGSLFGRFGFSDVLTLFQVLDAKVRLFHLGEMSIREFAELPRQTRDILVEVIVPKQQMRVSYLSMRNTETDFPVLACAVSVSKDKAVCAVGARPAKAVQILWDAEKLPLQVSEEEAKILAAEVADSLSFGSNCRGSAAYRKKLCQVLVRRAIMECKEVQ